jgi:hypothetical protein
MKPWPLLPTPTVTHSGERGQNERWDEGQVMARIMYTVLRMASDTHGYNRYRKPFLHNFIFEFSIFLIFGVYYLGMQTSRRRRSSGDNEVRQSPKNSC